MLIGVILEFKLSCTLIDSPLFSCYLSWIQKLSDFEFSTQQSEFISNSAWTMFIIWIKLLFQYKFSLDLILTCLSFLVELEPSMCTVNYGNHMTMCCQMVFNNQSNEFRLLWLVSPCLKYFPHIWLSLIPISIFLNQATGLTIFTLARTQTWWLLSGFMMVGEKQEVIVFYPPFLI